MPKSSTVIPFPIFTRRTQDLFTRMTIFWGKGENRLLDTGSELTLIPGYFKNCDDSPVKVETYGGKVISGVVTDV